MRFVGSKNRISKHLAPIVQSYLDDDVQMYIEPFVGGANMIDKINFPNKLGTDIHLELIELLKCVRDNPTELPNTITEVEYNSVKNNPELYDAWYVGLVGYCATFSSKFFGGYARGFKSDKVTPRNPSNESIRNLMKQSPNLEGVRFECMSYLEYNPSEYSNCVFYLDPPYKGTTKYNDRIDYDEFYKWCKELSVNNIVLISEYDMPSDIFECVWSKDVSVGISSQGDIKDKSRVEKLFKVI